MQLSWLSANQHKEILTTVQGKRSYFIYWMDILKLYTRMLRASSDKIQHPDYIYWELCNPSGPSVKRLSL